MNQRKYEGIKLGCIIYFIINQYKRRPDTYNKYSAQGVGALKEVLVHCPGDELDILTPRNREEFLFDSLVYKDEAKEEHRHFTKKLEESGVVVRSLSEIIKQAATDRSRELLDDVIRRLPNMFFIRDLAVITSDGAIISRMYHAARSVEPTIINHVFNELGIPILCQISPPGTVEGGDVIFLDNNTMMVGLSSRTNEEGIRQLRKNWLREGRVLATIPIQPLRESMHLDAVLGILSSKCILLHSPSIRSNVTLYAMDDKKEMKTECRLEDFLTEREIGIIEVTWEEQFKMACNSLMIKPDKRIIHLKHSFAENSVKNLEQRGIELSSVYLPQLLSGAGGPHCMTLELLREEV